MSFQAGIGSLGGTVFPGCVVNSMPKNPGYVTDQGFPNSIKGWGENPP